MGQQFRGERHPDEHEPVDQRNTVRKLVELIGVAINAACTNLNAEGTRRHIRAALDAGASQEEILFVLKCASVMAIHSCSLGAPILLEEAKAAGVQPKPKSLAATPAVDKMKAIGQWNEAWDPFYALDAAWTDEFMALGAGIYGSGTLPAKMSSCSVSPSTPPTLTCMRPACGGISGMRSKLGPAWKKLWRR